MRNDISKVVYERAKSNRTWASKTPRSKAVPIEADSIPFDEAPFHRRRKKQKHTNYRFEPLLRFLNARIGRHWDAVFSEFCSVTDPRTEQGSRMRYTLNCLVGLQAGYPGAHFSIHPKSGTLIRRVPS